ncbi:NAD(P)/FAD-dependent oxidoreductase [Sulfuricystis thermophila]|uniref:NAD(P)/FAD-dependent oxidoreductase n=1 Tax=Sulfuricystis thermophila TaxID=2496847 RepID=UPI001036C279|nr:NAD(P)/FAD-dependent oxidoreductase [Sulfuricystis thermophila]
MTIANRRDFLRLLGSASLVAWGIAPRRASAAAKAKVIVIGGGYGGAIAARYLKMGEPEMEVTLIERNKRYVSCPMSNEVVGGEASMDFLTFGYDKLERQGIKVIFDTVEAIDPQARTVRIKSGKTLNYDSCVLSPGVDFEWGDIEGYDEAAAQIMPHAWKAGPQTVLLAKQIQDMKDGGTFIICAPDDPFRCPPGPYERASLVAHYFKRHKPKSKIIILDNKTKFSKEGLFKQGWKQHYEGIITWHGGDAVKRVEPKTRKVFTEAQTYQGDVVNVIPNQLAGKIAHLAGVVDKSTGWCPVDFATFESRLQKNIYVIGDATESPMPKSGYSANSQAKICVSAILARLRNEPLTEPALTNTCYSLITPDHGISVAHIFELKNGKLSLVPGSGGVSPMDATPEFRRLESIYAHSWYKNITTEMFG